MGGKMSSKDKVTSCNSKATIVGRITVERMGSSLRSTVEKQIYKWAISKKIGFSEDTAKALAHFAKFLQTGKGITKKKELGGEKIKGMVKEKKGGKAGGEKNLK